MKKTYRIIMIVAAALLMCACDKDINPEALGGYFFGEGGNQGGGGGGVKPFEYEAVDLGLSVKWANCNVGATKPWEVGKYYAWGEVEEKSDYSWKTYKFSAGGDKKQTKYCDNSKYGTVDNLHFLQKSDDVASVVMGGSWRMPTNAEVNELIENCTWATDYKNDLKIIVATSTKNGATLTFPLGGYIENTTSDEKGICGYYWAAEIESGTPCDARLFTLDTKKSSINSTEAYRYYGLNVRGVRAK